MSEIVLKSSFSEIPKSCSECEMPDAVCDRRMLIWTRDEGKKHGFNSRHPDCPIVTVLPEGHGDLVDWNDVERALTATFTNIVEDEILHGTQRVELYDTQRVEYPPALVERPIRVKIIVPAERSEA